MVLELDRKDRKLLYELGKDSRQSHSSLGKKIRASKEVVNYRMNRLVKQGAIFKFITILDPAKLGYTLNKVMLKLESISKKKKKELVEYLRNHDSSLWTAECDGPFDVGFMLFARSQFELDYELRKIYEQFSNFINRKEISVNLAGEYFERRYLVGRPPSTKKEQVYGGRPKPITIDANDWKILRVLAEDARASSTDIAKGLPIKADAVRDRIRKLERLGIIKGYSMIIDNAAIGQIHYKVLIKLKDLSKKTLTGIRQFCIKTSKASYLIKSIGPWDLELDLEVESSEEYRNMMMSLTEELPNAIRSYDTLLIYKIHQYRYLPKKE